MGRGEVTGATSAQTLAAVDDVVHALAARVLTNDALRAHRDGIVTEEASPYDRVLGDIGTSQRGRTTTTTRNVPSSERSRSSATAFSITPSGS